MRLYGSQITNCGRVAEIACSSLATFSLTRVSQRECEGCSCYGAAPMERLERCSDDIVKPYQAKK